MQFLDTGGPQAGQQSAPHMHVLVCICSNTRQFKHEITLPPADMYNCQTLACSSITQPYFVGQNL